MLYIDKVLFIYCYLINFFMYYKYLLNILMLNIEFYYVYYYLNIFLLCYFKLLLILDSLNICIYIVRCEFCIKWLR